MTHKIIISTTPIVSKRTGERYWSAYCSTCNWLSETVTEEDDLGLLDVEKNKHLKTQSKPVSNEESLMFIRQTLAEMSSYVDDLVQSGVPGPRGIPGPAGMPAKDSRINEILSRLEKLENQGGTAKQEALF